MAPVEPRNDPDALPEGPGKGQRPVKGLGSLAVVVALVWGLSQATGAWMHHRSLHTLQGARPGDIEMFTTRDCVFCHRAAAELDAARVPWSDCPIDRDEGCRRRHAERGAQGTPLFRVKWGWRLGYDPQWMAQALTAPTGPGP